MVKEDNVQLRKFGFTIVLGLLSAAITAILLLLFFQFERIVPFGNHSLVSRDANIQYLDFFSYWKDVLAGKADFFYTFSKHLGGTAFSLFTYYLSSPFNILVIFFEQADFHIFFHILVLIKFSLSALTCTIFLSYRLKNIKEIFLVLLSVSYAFMQYNFAQSCNIMWLDGVYMLPIILLGVYFLVQENRFVLLSVSVGLAILFNWYSAGMDCLFSIIWCAVELLYLFEFTKERMIQLMKKLVLYGVSMFIGVGISACLFLPSIYSLLDGKGGAFDWKILNRGGIALGNPLSMIQNFTLSAQSAKGNVSLWTGSFVLIGAISYFIDKNKTVQEKRNRFFLLGILILMFYWMPLCFLFSLLKQVDSYWYRYSYLGSFILIYFAANYYSKAIEYKDGQSASVLFQSSLIFSFALLITDFIRRKYSIMLTYQSICFCIIIALISGLLIKTFQIKWCRILISGILGVIIFLELRLNAQYLIENYMVRDVEYYAEYVKGEQELIDQLKGYDLQFYRINQTVNRGSGNNRITANFNEALAYNYYSITGYTSVPETIQLEFLKRCGYQIMGETMNVVNASVLPVDSLLGVKYILSDFDINGLKYIDTIQTQNRKNVYENPYCLPIAFVYVPNPTIVEKEYRNPFLYLNDLYSELMGEEIELFKEVIYQKESKDKSVKYTLKQPDSKNNLIYGNILSYQYLNGNIYVDGTLQTAYSRWLSPSVFYIPNSGNDEIEVRLDTEESTGNISNEQFYYLDFAVFEECVNHISLRKADDISIRNGYISGSVTGREGEYLFLSVPYHEQWKILCNDVEVQPKLFGDCLITIPLSEGENRIIMKYKVHGFAEGIGITILSLCILFIAIFFSKSNKEKRSV